MRIILLTMLILMGVLFRNGNESVPSEENIPNDNGYEAIADEDVGVLGIDEDLVIEIPEGQASGGF